MTHQPPITLQVHLWINLPQYLHLLYPVAANKYLALIKTIQEMVVDRCDLPESFCVNDYELFQGISTKVLKDYDIIDIGGREHRTPERPPEGLW